MIKRLGLLTAICLIGLYNLPVNAQDMSPEEQYKAQREARPNGDIRPRLKMPQSIIVCRAKQCAPAHLSMAKEYIFNTLLHMFDSNARQKVLVCQGNANTHACTEEFIRVPITVGITPADLYIDDVKIADVSISQKNTMAMNLLLNWGVSYNGQTPVCRPSKNLLYVKNINNVIMEDNGYNCKMTTIGNTSISTMFAIDYIDLDYGYIGGYYSIGLSGPAFGGGSGYMILRLPNDITIEAKDFEVKPLEPKIEESVEETIEEIPFELPQNTVVSPSVEEKPVLKKVEEKVSISEPVANPRPINTNAPVLHSEAPTGGQYLYDSNTGQYIPLNVSDNQIVQPQTTNPATTAQVVTPAQPAATPANNVTAQSPFVYAATAHKTFGSNVSNTMPTDAELLADLQPQAPLAAPVVNQTTSQQTQMPTNTQYIYDANSGQYIPVNNQYKYDAASGQYIPVASSENTVTMEQADTREPQAPNVKTIIKYNHPAQEYEKAKEEAAAEAERQRKVQKKEKEREAQAVDFGGVKVYPIPSSNEDRTLVAPTLKNALSEYNKQESRRFE